MCRVISCVVGRGCLLRLMYCLGKISVSLCPASFCTPRPNLPVTPGMSGLPASAFQFPFYEKDIFFWCSRIWKYYFLKKEITPICIFLRLIILSIFSHVYRPFVCLLWRNVYSNLLPIFSCVVFVLSYESSLYILDIRPLSDYVIYKTILPFCGLSFSLSRWGPWKHKSVVLTRPVYLFFFFWLLVLLLS